MKWTPIPGITYAGTQVRGIQVLVALQTNHALSVCLVCSQIRLSLFYHPSGGLFRYTNKTLRVHDSK